MTDELRHPGAESKLSRSKLTVELQKIFIELARAGNTVRASCSICGIMQPTYYAWLHARDRDAEAGKKTAYTLFFAAIEKARGEFQAEQLDIIRQAAIKSGTLRKEVVVDEEGASTTKTVETQTTDWGAAAWLLERSDPENFGKKNTTEITAGQGTTIKFEIVPAAPPAVPPEAGEQVTAGETINDPLNDKEHILTDEELRGEDDR